MICAHQIPSNQSSNNSVAVRWFHSTQENTEGVARFSSFQIQTIQGIDLSKVKKIFTINHPNVLEFDFPYFLSGMLDSKLILQKV